MTSLCCMNSSWITATEGSNREEETIIRQYIIEWTVKISKISLENIPHEQYFPFKELWYTFFFFVCSCCKPLLEFSLENILSPYSWYSCKSALSGFLQGEKQFCLSWCDNKMRCWSKFTPFQISRRICAIQLYLSFPLTFQNFCHPPTESP